MVSSNLGCQVSLDVSKCCTKSNDQKMRWKGKIQLGFEFIKQGFLIVWKYTENVLY